MNKNRSLYAQSTGTDNLGDQIIPVKPVILDKADFKSTGEEEDDLERAQQTEERDLEDEDNLHCFVGGDDALIKVVDGN